MSQSQFAISVSRCLSCKEVLIQDANIIDQLVFSLVQIVDAVDSIVKQDLEQQTIQNAQDNLDGVIHYFKVEWPAEQGSNPSLDSELSRHMETLDERVLSVLDDNDCFNGSTWSAYMVAAGLQIQIVQERVKRGFYK